MKSIEAYQTSDGKIFTEEKAAIEHQADVIGEALDDLIQHDEKGNIYRGDRLSMLLNTLKHPEFKQKLKTLYSHVFADEYEEYP
ncbi:MAG: hypothetical protein ACK50N_00370 [Flavobacteriales bacterium]